MPRITLNSASFHGFTFSTGPKRGDGAPIVIAEFSAPWTEKNREAGKWKELPDTVSGNVKLMPGELAASHFEFRPARGLDSHAFSLDCSAATNFHCFVPTKEGEERELRFSIETPSKSAGRTLDSFGRVVGSATGRLTISYDEATQELLTTEEQRNAALSDLQ